MRLALFALAVLAAAFLFHAILWRLRLPRRHTPALLAIFLGALPAALALAALVPSLRAWLPASAWEYLLLASFHVPLSLAYVAFYSAIEADSPSCLIAARVARAGGAGCTRAELAGAMGDDEVLKRLPGMAGFGFAAERGGQLRLLPRGRLLVRFYTALDAVLGLGAGG